MENQFIAAWSEITAFYRADFDSLGSRLHRGADGIFYAYAQWKSAADRKRAFGKMPDLPAVAKMKEAIAESFPAERLEMLSDYLILPKEK